jgi:tetratricopeptide (TPR) repeat protein
VLAAGEAAFIDTETTGLAGGTGTVAFLIGAGWVEGNAFVLRQYFMRDYPDEAAVLHALEEDLGERPLVSFNGRSFDWPLLTTRWRMHRSRPGQRAHLDLLTAARRLWSRTLHSHSLATLERHVLGLERGEDLPGYMIPSAWFDYVRGGWAGTIAQAFRHNEIDVVSMLALFARVGAILEEPVGRVEAPEDRLGTARLLLDLGDPDRARSCLEAGLAEAAPLESRGLHRLLGHMCRRNQEWSAALAHWKQVAELDEFDAEAYEQVAKLYEHKIGDHAAALHWTTAALEQVVEGTRQYEAFAHRAARLERRILKAGT